MCRILRALQQNLLETEAFLDYLEHQAHIMDSAEAVPLLQTDNQYAAPNEITDKIDSIHTFIYSHDNSIHCKTLGINHWLVQSYNLVLQTPIKDITYLAHPDHIGLSQLNIPTTLPAFL